MKKKTIWSLVLALALVVSAIGTATSAFAATPAPMEPVTKIATENEDAVWEQIEAIEYGDRKTVQQECREKTYSCTISIGCSTIFDNLELLRPEKKDYVPDDGVILGTVTATFEEGDTVFEVLKSVCRDYGIQLEYSWTPMYGSYYIEGIHNLYEFDCGDGSGWMYSVNGWFPNYGCSSYELKQGDVIKWLYTCDLGADVGSEMH